MCKIPVVICLSILGLMNTPFCRAQHNDFGAQFGYGVSSLSNGSSFLVNPLQSDGGDYFNCTVSYDYSPKRGIIGMRLGIQYANRNTEGYRLGYLKVPLGFDLYFGKKVQWLMGGGLYTGVLIHANKELLKNKGSNSVNRFQMGGYLNTGFCIQLSRQYFFSLRYTLHMDVYPLYKDPNRMNNFVFNDGYFGLGLKYRWTKY